MVIGWGVASAMGEAEGGTPALLPLPLPDQIVVMAGPVRTLGAIPRGLSAKL